MPIIEKLLYWTDKSSHWRCSIKKAVRKDFAIFTRITCVVRRGWNKVKKWLQHRFFPVNIAKISNNTCFEEHLCMATSENNKKRFLRKATGHNDLYMINMAVKGQRLAAIDCWLILICSAVNEKKFKNDMFIQYVRYTWILCML